MHRFQCAHIINSIHFYPDTPWGYNYCVCDCWGWYCFRCCRDIWWEKNKRKRIREASELKNVTESGKSPKGGRGQPRKSNSSQFQMWTFWQEGGRPYFHFGTSVRRSSRSAFGRSTGNEVSGLLNKFFWVELEFL